MCSCENQGAGGRPVGDRSAGDTSTKKDSRKKADRKKQTILHQFFSSTTRQSTINQIFNQSDKMDYADVNDT